MTFRFKGFHHAAMITADMDRTIRFWRDLVGLRLVGGHGDADYRQYFFQLGPNNMIAFFQWNGAEAVEGKDPGYPLPGPAVFDHLCLELENLDQVRELKAVLEAADFPVSGVIDHGFVQSVYTWDPNGIPVEFSARVETVDLTAHPVMADRVPTGAAREGPEPQPGHWPRPDSNAPPDTGRVYPGGGKKQFRPE
jgi:catechol 2,3-dioxygenase-like lactoylglutathione lyase family enzyme